jgi:hypothetical protein
MSWRPVQHLGARRPAGAAVTPQIFLTPVSLGFDNGAGDTLPILQSYQAHPQQLTSNLQGWTIEELVR